MSEVLTGCLAVFISLYVSLIVVPITHTLRASISAKKQDALVRLSFGFPVTGRSCVSF
jgi:hypothetical protein